MFYPSIAFVFLLEVYFLVGHVCSLISILLCGNARDTAGYACEMTFDFLPKTTSSLRDPKSKFELRLV